MEPTAVIKPWFALNQVLSDLVLYSQERFTGATGDDPTLSLYIFFFEGKKNFQNSFVKKLRRGRKLWRLLLVQKNCKY
jgi:hypothetical protein